MTAETQKQAILGRLQGLAKEVEEYPHSGNPSFYFAAHLLGEQVNKEVAAWARSFLSNVLPADLPDGLKLFELFDCPSVEELVDSLRALRVPALLREKILAEHAVFSIEWIESVTGDARLLTFLLGGGIAAPGKSGVPLFVCEDDPGHAEIYAQIEKADLNA